MNEDIISAVIFLAFTAVVVGGVILLEAKGCENRWEGTYQTDWSMLGGCRVKVDDKFLPEANVREIIKAFAKELHITLMRRVYVEPLNKGE